jgi:transcriptional regulator with XRE-family HTH domain
MADTAFLAGPAIRRLRRREGLTQAAMAARLAISPSYLNLIERNQRPLSARLLVQLAEAFDFDPRSLRQDEAVGGIDGLKRRLSDERFADLGIDRDEIAEWLAAAPQAALAFARLFDAGGSAAGAEASDPMDLTRREIERWRNHFADLDAAAEELSDELRLSNADMGAALAERLRQKHQSRHCASCRLRSCPMHCGGSICMRGNCSCRSCSISPREFPCRGATCTARKGGGDHGDR